MIKIERLETIAIGGTTKDEVQIEVDRYIALGYTLKDPIAICDDPSDPLPYFAYVELDELS